MHINNSSFRGGVSEAVWRALRLYTPTRESTAVVLRWGLHSCASARCLTKVDCHRIAQRVCGYQRGCGCNSSQWRQNKVKGERWKVWCASREFYKRRVYKQFVILRRGNRGGVGCWSGWYPDARIYRCRTSLRAALLRISTVFDKGRLPQNCTEGLWVSARLWLQFFAMTT